MYTISAHCIGLDPEKHKKLETATEFPVARGDVITVTCKSSYLQVQRSEDVTMTCNEGTNFSQQVQMSCAGTN